MTLRGCVEKSRGTCCRQSFWLTWWCIPDRANAGFAKLAWLGRWKFSLTRHSGSGSASFSGYLLLEIPGALIVGVGERAEVVCANPDWSQIDFDDDGVCSNSNAVLHCAISSVPAEAGFSWASSFTLHTGFRFTTARGRVAHDYGGPVSLALERRFQRYC